MLLLRGAPSLLQPACVSPTPSARAWGHVTRMSASTNRQAAGGCTSSHQDAAIPPRRACPPGGNASEGSGDWRAHFEHLDSPFEFAVRRNRSAADEAPLVDTRGTRLVFKARPCCAGRGGRALSRRQG